MNSIQPPHLKRDFIWKKAEEFRQKYVHPQNFVPVPIIEIVELDLKLEIIPISGLMRESDIDGFLTRDLKRLCIDHDLYMDQRKETRLRFTYAHEIGHLMLHEKEIQQCQFRTPEAWIRFREDFVEEDLSWFEYQAYEFAGRLLVPKEELIQEIDKLQDKTKEFLTLADDQEDMLIQAISRIICSIFMVSADVISRRIRREEIKLIKTL